MRIARTVGTTALAVGLVTACSSSPSNAKRPVSNAKLAIVSPAPGQVTGSNLHVEFNLVGATVVPATQNGGPLVGDRGHIHVLVDGKLLSMAYGTSQDLPGLAPGKHALEAEFVAVDHRPFSPRILNRALFEVKGT